MDILTELDRIHGLLASAHECLNRANANISRNSDIIYKVISDNIPTYTELLDEVEKSVYEYGCRVKAEDSRAEDETKCLTMSIESQNVKFINNYDLIYHTNLLRISVLYNVSVQKLIKCTQLYETVRMDLATRL